MHPILKVLNGVIDMLRFKKIVYVVLWSVGLFVATFFTFCESFDFAAMDTMTALNLAEDYLFPLFLAMSLFLIDAQYVMITEGRQFSSVFLVCFIFFILAAVASVLVDHAIWGWVFFIAAWIALTVLKASMILDVNGVEIDNK